MHHWRPFFSALLIRHTACDSYMCKVIAITNVRAENFVRFQQLKFIQIWRRKVVDNLFVVVSLLSFQFSQGRRDTVIDKFVRKTSSCMWAKFGLLNLTAALSALGGILKSIISFFQSQVLTQLRNARAECSVLSRARFWQPSYE